MREGGSQGAYASVRIRTDSNSLELTLEVLLLLFLPPSTEEAHVSRACYLTKANNTGEWK